MTRRSRLTGKNGRKRADTPVDKDTEASGEEYRTGPGRPPKEFQYKPGQSGNPKGAKRKAPSIATDCKAALERALSKKVTLRQGEKEQLVTKVTAGIEQLVNQFATGDRHARRDVFDLAQMLGVDLSAGAGKEGETHSMTEAEASALMNALRTVLRLHHHEVPAGDVDPYGDGGEVVALRPVKPPAEPEE
jgi:Family of unknown function (DUF5681)